MPHPPPSPGFSRNQRKAKQRLARLRTEDPKALSTVHFTQHGNLRRKDRAEILRAERARAKRESQKRAIQKKKEPPFNPLEPLSGKSFDEEAKAAEHLEFGARDQELRQAQANQAQTGANRAQYYEDYRQALREATGRVNEANRVNVETQEGRASAATAQEDARVQARDQEVSAQAKLLGRAPVSTEEGHRAVAAQRTASEGDVSTLRGQAAADSKYMELRGATAALGKAQAMDREGAKASRLREEGSRLAKEKGDFRVAQRSKARTSEREWAAIQSEFDLKKRGQDLTAGNNAASRKLESAKLRTQQIVANIYAAADRSKARAQVRVAQLQLEKGKISKSQYRHIVNEYRGLPGNKDKGKTPKLQGWEQDRVSDAVHSLEKHGARANEKEKWLKKMQDAGVPLRLARIAWEKYRGKAPGTTYNGPN